MEEVRRRYRALAWQYHPDHHPDDPEASARFRELAEAYETIQQSRSRSRAAAPKFTPAPLYRERRTIRRFFRHLRRGGQLKAIRRGRLSLRFADLPGRRPTRHPDGNPAGARL